MTKQKIKLASKVIFVIISFILLVKIISMVFTESLEIELKEVKIYEVSQEEITSSGREITIKSFKDGIDNVYWINDEELLIEGVINNKLDNYVFNMAENELKIFKGKNNFNSDYGEYEFLKNIPGYGDLCILNNQIGLITQSSGFKVIAGNASYKNKVLYTLSSDLSKLAYYHNGNQKIVTYSFEKDFYRTIKTDISENQLNNFNKYIKLSPIGGYLSIEIRAEELEKSVFYVYGADSGREYAVDVMGVQLSWAPDDSKVSFYYAKESEVLNTKKDFDIKSKRVGYFNVKTKKIEYLDSLNSETTMISKLNWSLDGTRVSTLIGENYENQVLLKSIYEYDFSTNKISEISLNELNINLSQVKVDLVDYDDVFILVVDSSNSYNIKRILKDTSEVIEFKDLVSMNINGNDNMYYSDLDAMITSTDVLITVTKSKFQGFIQLNEGQNNIYPSNGIKYLAVWSENSNEIKILNTK